MANASRTTFSTAPASIGDPEGLPTTPKDKPLLPSVFSWLVGVVRRHPFFSATFLHLALVGVTAGIARVSYDRDVRPAYGGIPYGENGIALIGHGYLLDLATQTLSVKWEIVGCGTYRLTTYPPVVGLYGATGCDCLDRAADIYFNGAPTPTFSYDPANFPLVTFSTGVYVPLYLSTLTTFKLNHNIDWLAPGMAPFDIYYLAVVAFAVERATNKSVPIIKFATEEAPDNFAISSFDIPAIGAYNYTPGTAPTPVGSPSVVVKITVTRSLLARAFTVCLLLVNLALPLGSSYITFIVFVRREEGVHDGVLLLPVTIILTIPALRNLFVGSPPFGIYLDTFGFFLQMMIVALCSMVLLYVVATSSARDRRTSGDKGNAQSLGTVDESVTGER